MSDAALRTSGTQHRAADAVLNALPLPVITVAADGRIADANVAAESFFEASAMLLRRQQLRDLRFHFFGFLTRSAGDEVPETRIEDAGNKYEHYESQVPGH